MSSALKGASTAAAGSTKTTYGLQIRAWRAGLVNWEFYAIVLIAAFLRLYRINTTEFNGDQAAIFQMAHDAVSHAHLVATSNIASIGIFNPPGIIYFLMIAAAFSADPLAGALLTAMLSTLAVLVTYMVVYRYYGRLAGTIASSLYAVGAASVFYSRFMWNQNLLLFFVPLFIGVLLYGVIERRKGWFAPALILVGLLAQLHGSGFLLAAPLVVAFLLVPGTIRIRDVVLGLLGVLAIYGTYLLWLAHSHYRDIPIFLTSTRGPSVIDDQALSFFIQFLSPYGFDPNTVPLTNPQSLLLRFSSLFFLLTILMVVLVTGSAVAALVAALRPTASSGMGMQQGAPAFFVWRAISGWWRELHASPYRCALWVLLSWQLLPLIYLLRHSIKLHSHYFIMFMPGPFILLAIFLVNAVDWTRRRALWGRVARYGIYGLSAFLVAAQALGGLALMLDTARGNFNADYNRFNALSSLQHAFGEADQFAQSHHLKHVYVSTDDIRRLASYYLSELMHTPTTVFDNGCALLPSPAAGPAVLLADPNSQLVAAMIERYANVTLLDQPTRLNGTPFRLYLVETLAQQPAQYETLAQNIQFLGAKNASKLAQQRDSWLVTRWELLRPMSQASSTTYTYRFQGRYGTQQKRSECVLTAGQAGDQLLAPMPLPTGQPSSVEVQVQAFMTRPDVISVRPAGLFTLSFDTFDRLDTPHTILQTTDGKKAVSVSIS